MKSPNLVGFKILMPYKTLELTYLHTVYT